VTEGHPHNADERTFSLTVRVYDALGRPEDLLKEVIRQTSIG
jgi:hypothetical protein